MRFRPQDGILRPGDGRDIRFVSRILYSFRGFKPNWLFTNQENSDIIPKGSNEPRTQASDSPTALRVRGD